MRIFFLFYSRTVKTNSLFFKKRNFEINTMLSLILLLNFVNGDERKCLYEKVNEQAWQSICSKMILRVCEGPGFVIFCFELVMLMNSKW